MTYGKTFSRALHSAPELETLELEKGYAFSFNPQKLWDGQPSHLLPFINHTLDSMVQCVKGVTILVVPEMSSIGKVHFHGWIYIHHHIEYIATMLKLAQLGSYCIKPIKDPQRDEPFDTEDTEIEHVATWDQYVFKQQNIMSPVISTSRYSYPAELREPQGLPK